MSTTVVFDRPVNTIFTSAAVEKSAIQFAIISSNHAAIQAILSNNRLSMADASSADAEHVRPIMLASDNQECHFTDTNKTNVKIAKSTIRWDSFSRLK